MYRIGVDIGGTKILVGLFCEKTKELVKKVRLEVKDVKDIVTFLKESIESIIEGICGFGEISGIGIGVPGTVSGDGKRIVKVPNIDVLTENFGAELEDILNVPVALVQDSRAAALGEYLCGKGKGAKTLVCITLGTGIGTGIVMDGKIYAGVLGAAGELGHLPVKENGRHCGCGKLGCMEKYVAGGGLDINAREMYGEDKTSAYLFELASKGDLQAKEVIEDAVNTLGRGLVSVINLLSPDCILFSGGLSSREELYLNPLIEYLKNHCYSAGELPVIEKAGLGELSPLYGAAFLPIERKCKPLLSASIMCADILNMGKSLKEIETAGIDYIHCDIMDNHFVPNLMLPMELLNQLKKASNLPFDYHIMAENPETIIEKLDLREGDFVSVHFESTPHIQRAITLIKEKGAGVSVAINPATPISVLEEILPQLDMVLIMSVNPGFAGQKIVASSFEKIKKMKNMLRERNLNNILIQVDGNCSFENVPKMYKAGGDMFVVGTSSVFNKDFTIKEGTEKLLKTLN